MEEKNIRELSKDEMDKIFGGRGQQTFEKPHLAYVCSYCRETFSTGTEMNNHIREAHPDKA